MIEAQINDRKKLIQDFDNLLTEQWPCSIVGMYVSKYLTEPRHALKVYDLLSRSVKQVSEKVQKLNENLLPTQYIVDYSRFLARCLHFLRLQIKVDYTQWAGFCLCQYDIFYY